MAKGLSDDEIMKFIKSKDVSSKDYKAPKTKITRVDLSRIKTDNVKNTKTDNSVKNKVLRRTLVNTKPDNNNKKVNQTIYNKNAVRTSQKPEPKSIGSIDIVRNQSELRKTQNELQRQREKKLNPEGKNAAVETVKQAKQAMRAVENVGEKEAKNLIDFSTNAYKYAKAIKNRDDKQEAEAVSNMANAFDRSLVGRGVKTAGNFATRTGYGALEGADWMLDWGIDKITSKPLQYAEFAEKAFNPDKKEEINKKYDTIQNYLDDYTKLNLAENIYEDLGWDEDAYRTWEKGSLVNRNNIGGQVAETMGEQFLPLLLGSEISSGLVGNEIGNKFAGTKLSKATAGLTGASKYLTGIKTVGKNAAKYFIKNAPSLMPFWTTSYGGALQEALNEGATREEARRYATLNAAVETGTEMMFDGIPAIKGSSNTADAIANGLIDKATGKITNKFAKQVVSYLARMGYVGAGEGAEEMVSEILNPLLKNATYSNGEKIDWKQVLQSGMMGFISGEVMGAQNTFEESRNAVNNQINRETFQNSIQNTVNNAAQTTFQEITSQLDQLAQQRVQQIGQAVRQGQMTLQEGTQEIEDILRYVDAQKNTLQQEQQPQQNQNNQLAEQAVQQINQQVQSGQISPQDGIQQIEDIQNYLRATESNQTAPVTNETQQSNVIGQEQQNVAQNANNEVAQNQQQSGNLVEDYMNDNYESMVGDYIDQNYGQEQRESNLVEDYMNENQSDNVVEDYMNNYEDGNMVENYMNAQSELQQTQQDNIKKQTNAFNLGQNETKLPTNTDDKIQNFRNSVKNENVKDADGFYKAVEKIISDKDYNVVLDSSIKNKQGRAVNALITNENGITIKINPKSKRAAEILLIHEVTHGIETKEMRNLIMDYASKNPEFNEALESLKKAYGTNDVTPEVVADICGQLFGNQEFINSLSTEKPGLFKRIYNKIVEVANKLTGNSKEALFVRDLKNKWETAYREANIESSQIKLKDQVKYSQDGKITDNKGRELNINMQNYMEDSQATDDKGQLVTLYHTTTDMIKQFNVFDPANKYDGNYNFGKYNVTYLTDNQEMSGSYSQYDYRKANTKRLNSIEEANEYLDYNSSLRIVDIENTNQAIKNHFEGNPNRYFLVSGDLTTFGEYKTEQELLRDVIPTSQWVMRGNSNFQYEVYANITKPYIIDAEGRNWDNIAREIVQEYKDVVDGLSQEQKQELTKYAEDSINKYSDWAMSKEYTEYLKYNDEYKMLDNTTEENLVLLSMKENVTPQDYIDMYYEFGKESKSPDSKITVDGEEMTFAEYAARWCNLEMENAKYAYAYSYFLTQASKQYRNQLRQVGVEKMFDMAQYGFRDWAVEDNLSRVLKTNDIVNKVIEMNENGEDYDGVIIINTTDYGPGYVEEKTPHDVYVVFNSNQIKSVDNPDPTNDPDIRYSEKAKQWQDFLEKNYKNTGTTTKLNEKIGTEEKQTEVPQTQNVEKQITDTINNEIKKNEIINNIEKQEGRPVRQGVKTITTATGTTNLISEMDNKVITYDPLSNEKVLNQVRGENAGKDLPTLYQECIDFIQSDKRIHAKDIAKIELTLTELQKNFNDKANIDMFTDLVQQAATLGTTDAQALQFMGVIKKLNPMSQLTALQRAVENSIKKGDKAFEGVQIKQELVDKVLQTQQDGKVDQKAFDEAMNALMDDIGLQMKVSFWEQVNTWRYLSMLCNFKTHLRNIAGNTMMFGLQSYKDIYAAIGESTYDTIQKIRGKEGLQERTATLRRATKEIKEFSKQKAEEIVKGQKNKYYESSKGIVGELKSRRKIWSDKNIFGKSANKLNKKNTDALNLEDKVFSKAMVQKRLANYLAANMIRNQADMDAHPDVVARAIDYATYKGKEVTYHQESTTADAIKQARDNLYKGKGYSKLGGLAIDTTLPFMSTPANLAKTGLEYTPIVGTGALQQQIKNAPKELKANVVIDNISKQFTGMTLVAAGMFLAGKGILRGIGDDDKEDEIRENLGEKNYSLKIGNQYFDVSFLAPTTIPLFEGVELYKSLKKEKGFDLKSSIDVMFGALSPETDMSVLQSVFSLMKSLGYGKNAVQQATGQTFSSYLMQFFPTFFSQAAQAIDPYQRKTNTGETVIDKTFDQIKNKIPGLRQTLPKKMNVWGEEQKNAENPFIRGLEAFLSPSNRSENKVDDTTKELFELAKKYDNKNKQILPTIQDKNLTINSVDYKTYGKDFENLQRTYGKTAKENLDKLLKSDSYKNASMDDKAYMIGQLYDYAEHKSKEEYAKNNNIEYGNKNTNRYSLVDAFGIDYEKYVEQRLSKIKSDKNEDGSSKKNATSKYLKALNELGLDELQKQAVMNFENKSYYIDEKAVENKINSSNLPDNQKKMLIEKIKKNVSKTEKERYKRAENIGVSYDLYSNFRQYATSVKADKTKNGGYVRGSKEQKIINWIESQNISASQKQKLYNDYKNNQGITTYYK